MNSLIIELERQLYAEIFKPGSHEEAKEFLQVLKKEQVDFLSYVSDKNDLSSKLAIFFEKTKAYRISIAIVLLTALLGLLIDIIGIIWYNTSFIIEIFTVDSRLLLIADGLLIIVIFTFILRINDPHKFQIMPGDETRTIRLMKKLVKLSKTKATDFVQLGIFPGFETKIEDDNLALTTEFIHRKRRNSLWLSIEEFLSLKFDKKWANVEEQVISGQKINKQDTESLELSIGFRLKASETNWDPKDIFNTFEVDTEGESSKVRNLAWYLSALSLWLFVFITGDVDENELLAPQQILLRAILGDSYLFIGEVEAFFAWVALITSLAIIFGAFIVLADIKTLVENVLAYQNFLSDYIEYGIYEVSELSQEISENPDLSQTLRLLSLQNNVSETKKLPKHYFGIYVQIIALIPVIYSVLTILLERVSI